MNANHLLKRPERWLRAHRSLLLACALVVLSSLLSGCGAELREQMKTLVQQGIQLLGTVIVITAILIVIVLLINGKISLLTNSSRGIGEVALAIAAVFVGLVLALLSPVIVDAIYSGLSNRQLIDNTIPIPFK